MNGLVASRPHLPPTTDAALARVREVEAISMTVEQLDLVTHHVLHGGMYSRTITLEPSVLITGAMVKVPTLLVLSGRLSAYIGEDIVEINGHHALAGSAGRKQAFMAIERSSLTMIFATNAKSVDEAEQEFTDEFELLVSRQHPELNTVLITGE